MLCSVTTIAAFPVDVIVYSSGFYRERSEMLKAAYYEGHRRVRVGECKPVDPAPGQVQIKFRTVASAAATCTCSTARWTIVSRFRTYSGMRCRARFMLSAKGLRALLRVIMLPSAPSTRAGYALHAALVIRMSASA